MALLDMTNLKGGPADGSAPLKAVLRTSFAALGIQERGHLQAALRDHIDVLDDGLFVISEEFGDFEGVQRRIDLLCLDRSCRLVVVELKRTSDGGHMELQALRYAAMVSTMTFSQVVGALARYRKKRDLGNGSEESARADLVDFLDIEDEEPVVPREVGIVLASEDFSQEITTTVLWLNEFHDFDIRCVRLSPYSLGERLLLDAQQVVPLPEASAYTVRVREKENAEKKAKASGSDLTKFVVETPSAKSPPLAKRWAMLHVVQALVAAGVDMERVQKVLPRSKTFFLEGTYGTEDELWAAVMSKDKKKNEDNRQRWHLSNPLIVGGDTWLLHNNWGTGTREFFKELQALAPSSVVVKEEGEVALPAE